MGIIKISADNVYCVQQQQENQITTDTSIKPPMPKDAEKKLINFTKPLTKETLVEKYRDAFTGVECLQTPVSFKVKDDVVPD